MPFPRNSSKHRRYPYGPGAGFAIGSGERLAVKRRETAQVKAFMRRYPGMLPQAMNAVTGGMFGNGSSTGQMNGFDGLGQTGDFDGFEETKWEDPTATLRRPFSRMQQHSPFAFASHDGPAFGTQQQSFWSGGDSQEGVPRSQGIPWPLMDEYLLEALHARRQPEDGYLDAQCGLSPRHFTRPFQQYQGGRCGPHQNEPLQNHRYYGVGAAGCRSPFYGRFDDQPDRGGLFGPFPHSVRSHSWRGSPRDSYERLRPEDL